MTQTCNGVLVLGLGNLLFSDDGLGVHAMRGPRARTARRCRRDAPRWRNPRCEPACRTSPASRRLLVHRCASTWVKRRTLVRFEGKALAGLPGKAAFISLDSPI